MKFSELTSCPFCGGEEFFIREKAEGFIKTSLRFDGGDADTGDMFDDVTPAVTDGKAYCSNCGAPLGYLYKDTIFKATGRQLLKNQEEQADE